MNTIIGKLILTLLSALYIGLGRLLRPTSGAHGTARFANPFERLLAANRGKRGLPVDGRNRISETWSYQNLILSAAPGRGKTSGFIIPAALLLEDCSMLLTDPSGEIFEKTSGYLAGQGYAIRVLDVTGLARSHRYNPLLRARTPGEIYKLAGILVEGAYGGKQSGNAEFWNSGARTILSILISCLRNVEGRYRHLAMLRHLLLSVGPAGKGLHGFVSEYADERTFKEFEGFVSQDSKVIQSQVSTATNAVAALMDDTFARLTARETLNFEDMRREKTALYLIVPENEIGRYSFFMKILYTQLMDYCMEMPAPGAPYLPIYFLLDEFGNIGRIPGFSQTINTLRKRKCSVSLILQDFSQLEAVYGKAGARSVMNACSSQIIYPGAPLETCERVERLLGRRTLRYRPPGEQAFREKGDPLMRADEIRRMPDKRVIYLYANRHPMYLKMLPYYKNAELRKRSALPPALPDREEEAPDEVPIMGLPDIDATENDSETTPTEGENP